MSKNMVVLAKILDLASKEIFKAYDVSGPSQATQELKKSSDSDNEIEHLFKSYVKIRKTLPDQKVVFIDGLKKYYDCHGFLTERQGLLLKSNIDPLI